MKSIHVVGFTDNGANLAKLISDSLKGKAWAPHKYLKKDMEAIESLGEWTKLHFNNADALIFISACGIAVRAIAPHIKNKTEDPAVIVLDDSGHNVISLLSGHLGGANDLARKIALITGGNAIITTATDVHGITAVDEWAVKNNCNIENIVAAKNVSAELLSGQSVGVAVTEQLQPTPWPVTLWLRPKNLVLGIGCKKNTNPKFLKEAAEHFLIEAGVSISSLYAVASIDLKKEEEAIIQFAKNYNIPFITYTAEELKQLKGTFTASSKVKQVTGVDNVCERAAVLKAEGPLLRSKTVYKGITFAVARCKLKEK